MISRMCVLKSRRCSFERMLGLVVMPLAKPRLSASSMSCRFAVSTKIFTRLLLGSAIAGARAPSVAAAKGNGFLPNVCQPLIERQRGYAAADDGRPAVVLRDGYQIQPGEASRV